MTEAKWQSNSIKTSEISLDCQNARIDANSVSTQEEIRSLLIKTEDVVELSKGIVKNKGLMYGERIIAIQEGDKYIVLEGNRRTCACQLLLDPNLIPQEYKSNFPACDNELKDVIKMLKADIAPDRLAAEITITKRHTEPGVAQWSPLAKQRRLTRLIDAGRSIEELMSEFGMEKSEIINTLKDYHIFSYAKNLPGWTEEEKVKLNDPKLKLSPFTRFFELGGVKKTLDFGYKEKGELVIKADKTLFDKAIIAIARELLIKEQVSGKGGSNTRTAPNELFEKISANNPALKKYLKLTGTKPTPSTKASGNTSASNATGAASASKTASNKSSTKTNKFFENLTCQIKDDDLLIVTKEISSIDYKEFPLASAFLLRALVERVLNYCIDKYTLRNQLLENYHSANNFNKGKEPGLLFIINFCIDNNDKMFNVKRIKDMLQQWKKDKDLLDIIIHGRWARPSEKTLEHHASIIRPTVEEIFSGAIFV